MERLLHTLDLLSIAEVSVDLERRFFLWLLDDLIPPLLSSFQTYCKACALAGVLRFTGIEFFGSNRCIFDGQHCIRYGEQTGGLLSSFSKWHYRRALACWYYGGIAIGTHLVESLYEERFLFQQTCIFTKCFLNFHIMLI